MTRLNVLAASAALLALTGGAANAVALVGTLGIQPLGASSVNFSAGTGSYSMQDTFLSAGTGDFSGISGLGKIDGAFSFSTSVGGVVNPQTSPSLMFGSYTFTPSWAETTSYTSTGSGSSLSQAFSVYFRGEIPGNSNAASYTLSCNSTGGSAFTCAGTLATPAASLPEPATMAILGAGLAGVGLIRRRAA